MSFCQSIQELASEYQYDLSNDIPEGTYWYHSHRHGSTALQVSSGMAGAFIIRGNRKPTPTSNGDLSTLLMDPETGQSYKEHTVLFPTNCLRLFR